MGGTVIIDPRLPRFDRPPDVEEEIMRIGRESQEVCHVYEGLRSRKALCGETLDATLCVHSKRRRDRDGYCRDCGHMRCPACMEFVT